MRLVILGPTYPFRGGIAHHTSLLAGHLSARHEVRLLTFARQYPQLLFPGQTDRDPSSAAVSATGERCLDPLRPWTWWQTARTIAAFDPELVVIAWWVPFWAPSLGVVARLVRRRLAAPLVFLCHNVLPHEGAGPLTRQLIRFALAPGSAFITHSAQDAADLSRLLPQATAAGRRVHQAVLPAHTIATGVDRAAARRRLQLPPEAPVALFFGFVRPYKGLDYLVAALPAAMAELPDLHLVVAGEFWLPVERFRQQAAALGVAERVHLHDGYVPNEAVGRFFGAADVVVLPYTQASQSGVVTLATEFGLPVIATRTGGLPETVLDGRTGLLVPPADSQALAGALVRLLGDPELAARLADGVRAERHRFGWDRLEALLASLATLRPSAGGLD